MKSRHPYQGYVIEARVCERKDGGFAAEFSAEEHDAPASANSVLFTQRIPDGAIRDSGSDSRRAPHDRPGFERRPAVVNG